MQNHKHTMYIQKGDRKARGIEISNSFTFDLIALNKAARNQVFENTDNPL